MTQERVAMASALPGRIASLVAGAAWRGHQA